MIFVISYDVHTMYNTFITPIALQNGKSFELPLYKKTLDSERLIYFIISIRVTEHFVFVGRCGGK